MPWGLIGFDAGAPGAVEEQIGEGDERSGKPLTSAQALQRFIPMWAMDVMGYRDLNGYAMRYRRPQTQLEHAVNAWADELSTHNVLYLDDWTQLGLDDVLGWTAGDTLQFCFLDPQMDVHRHNIVKFTELAAAHPDPVLRLWLMHALESSGEAFFEHTSALALEVEATGGVRLDYLAGRHDATGRSRSCPRWTRSPSRTPR